MFNLQQCLLQQIIQSGGFALMALFFYLKLHKSEKALIGALIVSWCGISKMWWEIIFKSYNYYHDYGLAIILMMVKIHTRIKQAKKT